MAHHHHHHQETPTDEFLEHLLGMTPYTTPSDNTVMPVNEVGLTPQQAQQGQMMLQLSSDGSGHVGPGFHGSVFPLGLRLEQGKPGGGVAGAGLFSGNTMNKQQQQDEASGSGKRFREDAVKNVNAFHAQSMQNTIASGPHPPSIRPRVRARRGQATDPHSIAERQRRERIAERIRSLQELVPSVNKTDRAAMLDEIVDYVKFLRLQVKVLSMSRLGGAGAVAPLVTDMPIASVEEEANEGGRNQPAWEKWSNDGTERQVAKLMEENVGSAMQFLQSKALCIMPISLASAIYHTQPLETSTMVKPETNPPS